MRMWQKQQNRHWISTYKTKNGTIVPVFVFSMKVSFAAKQLIHVCLLGLDACHSLRRDKNLLIGVTVMVFQYPVGES